MGVVYKAEDTRLKRHVALKFLPQNLTRDEEAKERFIQEAQAASALDHPNICIIHEIDETEDGRTFITMACYEGETLKEMIERGPLKLEEAIDIAIQVTQGLEMVHKKGIIHRDIKPGNIFITGEGVAKLLDFGLAKLAGQVGLTKAGTTLGTVAYMSPEQAGGEEVNSATDIWSLGVVMYEMLTGQRPFKGEYEQVVIYSILNVEPEPITGLRSDVTDELRQVVDKALAKSPDERYQLVQELLSDIRAIGGMKAVPEVLPVEHHTVGREKELAELKAGFQTTATGRGLLMCVAGEPGIGKTTLVEEFLNEVSVASLSCTIARGRCSERLAGTEAYLPFLEVLESLLKSQANGSVTKIMREMAPWWYAQVASLSDDDSSDVRLYEGVKTTTQERMKRELAAFLQEVSRAKPLILFFDDLHWSDVSTIDLLSYLASKFETMRMLIVTTYRPSELLLTKHPFLKIKPDLQSRGICREIELGFLSHEEIERYLTLEYPEHDFPGDFPKLIHDRTEGSPLFMADLVRYLQNREVVVEEEGSWTLVQSVVDIELDLPESIRGMIQRKIEYLGEDDRRMLVAASVQGYEFDTAVVGQVLEIDVEEVEERLQLLDRDYGFVRLIDEDEFPDRTLTVRYQFVHVLYQNALYASLTPTRKVSLSRKVAEALLGYYGERSSTVASELAMLFKSGRDFSRAVDYYYLATLNASQVFAYKETTILAQRGLELLQTLPDTHDRSQQELDFLSILGPAFQATRGYSHPEVEQTYIRTRELCQKVGETPKLFPVLYGLFAFHFSRGEHQTALGVCEQFLRVAQNQQDSDHLPVAHRVLGITLFFLGELSSSLSHFEEGTTLYDRKKHHSHIFLYGRDTGMDFLVQSSLVLWMLGYPEQAKLRCHEGLTLAREIDHPGTLVIAVIISSWIHQFNREKRLVKEYADEMVRLCTEQGFPLWLAAATIMRGWAKSAQGQKEEGIAQMRQGLDELQGMEVKFIVPYFLLLLAEGYGKARQAKEGLSVIAEALAVVNNTGERWWEAELHRIKGELLLMQHEDEAEIEKCFLKALDVAQRQSAKSLELRAAMSLSRLWQKQSKQKVASKMLKEIYGWFTEGFDTVDLKEAKALLRELS